MKEETYIDKVSGRTLYVVENPIKATHFQYNTTFYKDPEYTIVHREDGPALIIEDWAEKWYSNNKLHRLDGPATINLVDDIKNWFVDGVQIDNKERLTERLAYYKYLNSVL